MDREKPDLVSVIIPCYNEEKYVAEAIESVLSQTHEPIETIVIDDGSTDESLERIRAFDDQITWRTGKNQGACHARNWGVELSSGRFLMFLDADDRISPAAIAALVRELGGHENSVAACPWSFLKRKADGWREEEVDLSICPPEGDPVNGWLSGWYIPPCAILWSRTAYENTSGWDETLRANQDGDLMLRAFLNGTRLVQTRRGKSLYREERGRQGSISARQSASAIESRVRVLERVLQTLEEKGKLERYREALGKRFYRLARKAALVDDELYTECLERAKKYTTEPAGETGTLAHRVFSAIFGLQRKEKLADKLGEWGLGSKERRKSARLRSHSEGKCSLVQPRILYVQYTNPAGYPPLQRSSRILAKDGWDVRFLGTHMEGTSDLRFPPHDRICVRRMSIPPRGWRQKVHYFQYARWVLTQTRRWEPDWIYVSDPLAAPIGMLITFLADTPVLYHEHDSPSEEMPDSWFMRMVLVARRVLARRADLCVLPNETRAELFRQQTGAEGTVHCVWNCPAVEELPERRNRELDSGESELLYLHFHGSIVPSRLPTTVVQAMARLPSFVRLQVFGYETGEGGHLQKIQDVAEEEEVWDRIELRGSVPQHSKLLNHAQQADIGLSFMPMETNEINLRHMEGASNKPFEYLACGLPLLVSDLPEWRQMYTEPGYGRACNPNDPEDIAETVRALIQNREELSEMGQAGQERIRSEWNYETEFRPVRDQIKSLTE